MGTVLLRYEITGARESDRAGYEFSVVLTFQSKAATELKHDRNYKVEHKGGRWSIIAAFGY